MPTSPPIIAYHIIFGAYGFWLPNDPRGSWSKYVWADRLLPFGKPQPRARHEPVADEEFLRNRMKKELAYPPVRFTGHQALAVSRGFGKIIDELQMIVYASAIMPDHVHLVVARQTMFAEDIAGHLKRSASRQPPADGLHPLVQYENDRGRLPCPWEEDGWKVLLHTPDEIELAMYYVNQNPIEADLKPKNWPWIRRYEP